jgi:hypothetical protein
MEAKQELLNFTGKECPKEGEKPEEQNLFDGKEELLGWLSPRGDFFPADWGKHCLEAERILGKLGLYEEFIGQNLFNAGDFLSGRGYVLLHNPSKKKLIATAFCPLSKAQRNFLYGYFLELGRKKEAEYYLEEAF